MSRNIEGEKNLHAAKDTSDQHSGDVYAAGDYGGENIQPKEEETHRSLKPRQISMIAIGGAIGTGLVIGSGSSLARSGPASLFIAYVVMGAV